MIRLPKLKGKEIYEHRMRKIASKVSRDTGWKSQARKSLEGTVNLYESLGGKAQTPEPLKKRDSEGIKLMGIFPGNSLASS